MHVTLEALPEALHHAVARGKQLPAATWEYCGLKMANIGVSLSSFLLLLRLSGTFSFVLYAPPPFHLWFEIDRVCHADLLVIFEQDVDGMLRGDHDLVQPSVDAQRLRPGRPPNQFKRDPQ